MEDIRFRYTFNLSGGKQEVFDIVVEMPALKLRTGTDQSYPEWTRLEFCKCSNCPLSEAEHPRCPVAVPLVDVGERLGRLVSHEIIDLEVESEERKISGRISVTDASRSLIGLIMALSGCPHMEFFKPLARFHLPWASLEETTLRSASIYLLMQYFKKPGKPDWFFKKTAKTNWDTIFEGLSEIYREVQMVNLGMIDRLRASKLFNETSAIAQLDVFAQMLPISIENQIADLRYLFPPDAE